MDFDIDLLQELLNDTTESKWTATGTKIRITTLGGKRYYCDVKNMGDATFIAYVKNHAQELVDCARDNLDNRSAEAFCKKFDSVDDINELLDRLDEIDGFGDNK